MSVVIDVRDLVRYPGSSRALQVVEPIEGLAAGLAAVPQDRPVDADLLLESVVEGVLVSGPVMGAAGLVTGHRRLPDRSASSPRSGTGA